MVHRLILAEHAGNRWESIPLAIGLFLSVSALVALCARHTRRAREEEAILDVKYVHNSSSSHSLKPKQLASNMSRKAIASIYSYKKRGGKEVKEAEAEEEAEAEGEAEEEEEERRFGGGGLWQKAILMGEKCRAPEFAGAIFYDCYGNQISEPPVRSPRASPLFTFSIASTHGTS